MDSITRSVFSSIFAIPKHVAFILDGNRRYAAKEHISTFQGHVKGYDTLSTMLEECFFLGVKIVTVYAFSLDNFLNRSKSEISHLFDLATSRLSDLLLKTSIIHKYDTKVKFLGELSFLPTNLQQLCYKLESVTKNHSTHLFQICFAFQSSYNIAKTRSIALSCIKSSEPLISKSSEISTKNTMDQPLSTRTNVKCLTSIDQNNQNYTSFKDSFLAHIWGVSSPDILIRTSGETRLSDFLLFWLSPPLPLTSTHKSANSAKPYNSKSIAQSSSSYLYFPSQKWPEFTQWHLLKILFQWNIDRVM